MLIGRSSRDWSRRTRCSVIGQIEWTNQVRWYTSQLIRNGCLWLWWTFNEHVIELQYCFGSFISFIFLDSSSFPRRSSDGAADMPTLHRPYPLVGGSYPEQAHYRSEVSQHYHLEPHCVTCGGIHPGWAEPAPCMELTTSWTVDGSVRGHLRFSPNPFSIVRRRRLAVRRGAPGLPWV